MNTTSFYGSDHAQTHSRDYGVRVNRLRLQEMAFMHVCSYDSSEVQEDTRLVGVPTTRAGMTEWQSRVGGVAVSMAWDWMQLSDGAVCLLPHVAPRSNLQLLDDLGYDMATDEALALLWEKIGSIAWQRHAAFTAPIHLDR